MELERLVDCESCFRDESDRRLRFMVILITIDQYLIDDKPNVSRGTSDRNAKL